MLRHPFATSRANFLPAFMYRLNGRDLRPPDALPMIGEESLPPAQTGSRKYCLVSQALADLPRGRCMVVVCHTSSNHAPLSESAAESEVTSDSQSRLK